MFKIIIKFVHNEQKTQKVRNAYKPNDKRQTLWLKEEWYFSSIWGVRGRYNNSQMTRNALLCTLYKKKLQNSKNHFFL